MTMKQGILYIVATPIGNLEDMTFRALRVLREADLIAAEDTRRTKILLRHYGIDTPLTSLHDHNEREKKSSLISKLLQGSTVAYVSDAGTPGISDPGYLLLREAIAHSIEVIPIPGPSAVITALSISGLPMDSFSFHGFLPSRSGKRRQFLESLREKTETMIFFESPQRIVSCLRDIRDILGDREMTLSRELTKLHEITYRGRITAILEAMEEKTVKGEITMALAGRREEVRHPSQGDIRLRFRDVIKDGAISTRDAVDLIARETGMPKREVYHIVLKCLE